jgi:hypothetical protein
LEIWFDTLLVHVKYFSGGWVATIFLKIPGNMLPPGVDRDWLFTGSSVHQTSKGEAYTGPLLLFKVV